MQFPSAEWAVAFRSALNANAAYREAARAFEGDLLFRVRPADPTGPAPGIQLVLTGGECTSATFHADAREVATEFVFEGTADDWRRVLHREVDPVQAILHGTLKVRGNLAKLLRFNRAAKELTETAGTIPVDG